MPQRGARGEGEQMKSTATTIHLAGNTLILSLTDTPRQEVADLQAVVERGKQLSVEVKQYRQKRSLDANSYLWVLCQKIAEVIRSTKELVYQKTIREVGQFEILPIREDAVETFIDRWSSKGLGWFAEVLDDSKLPGYKKIIAYYGSSVYDTREMSILIDEIVSQAKELNIETLPPDEVESLKALWGKEN
jgi:hypothetical protein